jgi:hypothetical protein
VDPRPTLVRTPFLERQQLSLFIVVPCNPKLISRNKNHSYFDKFCSVASKIAK